VKVEEDDCYRIRPNACDLNIQVSHITVSLVTLFQITAETSVSISPRTTCPWSAVESVDISFSSPVKDVFTGYALL
jgi:hypothetical protein